jgi:hypothetical protein
MSYRPVASVVALSTLALVGSQVHGAVIAGWDFSTLAGGAGAWGASPFAATTVASAGSVGGLTRGSGILTPSGSTAAGNAWGGTDFLGTDLATATTANDFATFTVTVPSGNTLSLTGFDAYNIRRSGSGPTTGQWQYQIGSGSFTNIGSAITWGTGTNSAGNAQSAISLTGVSALQSVAAGTVVTFRVVTWGGTGTAGTWYLNGLQPTNGTALDFVLNGDLTAVPPPNTTPSFGAASYSTSVDLGARSSSVTGSVNVAVADSDSSQTLTLTAGTLPAGFSLAGFSPSTFSTPVTLAAGISSFGFTVDPSVANGSYVIPISVSDGTASASVNVNVTVVPEPASLAVLGGAASLLVTRRRR